MINNVNHAEAEDGENEGISRQTVLGKVQHPAIRAPISRQINVFLVHSVNNSQQKQQQQQYLSATMVLNTLQFSHSILNANASDIFSLPFYRNSRLFRNG